MTVTPEELDFKDAPVSIAEKRSEIENDNSFWKPRDLLVQLLRQIDNGEINPTGMVVIYDQHREKMFCSALRRANVTTAQTVALIEIAKFDLLNV